MCQELTVLNRSTVPKVEEVYLSSFKGGKKTKKGQTLGGDWKNSQKKTCPSYLEYFGLQSLKYKVVISLYKLINCED